MFRDTERALCDIASQVAHTFEICRDHLDCDHHAKILGDRSLEGEGLEYADIDFDIEAIDFKIVSLDLGCPRRVVGEMFGSVLRENDTMLDLCRRLGFRQEANRDDPGTVIVRLDLRASG